LLSTIRWPHSLLRGVRRLGSQAAPQRPHPQLPLLAYPIQPTPRVAVLGMALYSPGPIQIFIHPTPEQLDRFQPQALAGTSELLHRVAAWREQGRLAWGGWQYPLVVFSDIASGLLSAETRESLWKAFDLPIYEQIRGFDGALLAYECDAHDGLHVNSVSASFEASGREGRLLLTTCNKIASTLRQLDTGFSGKVEREICACGASVVRLSGLRPAPPEEARVGVTAGG
jgi:hypothetical protein